MNPTEPRPEPSPETGPEAQERYDQLLALADLFDTTGAELRERARLGQEILSDADVAASAELSPGTYEEAEADIEAAVAGKNGLLSRSIELDADALVVRATVLTYRWIEDLQEVAFRTLGAVAGRALGYLAPEVALGGAIVSAGLIETDSLDRDGLATYLGELAEQNPDLLAHLTTGGGGLVESLQLRSLLTASFLAGDRGPDAGRAGLESVGAPRFAADAGAALRDVAIGLAVAPDTGASARADSSTPTELPRGIADLMTQLSGARDGVSVQRLAGDRFIAYLAGGTRTSSHLRLVDGDIATYAAQVVAAIETAVGDTADAKVMLVGAAHGGLAAAEVAASAQASQRFTVDQVVTAGAPSAQVTVVPDGVRVLALEDRSDPVALLGSLINQGVRNRVTVVFDADRAREGASDLYVTGGRAADSSTHPALRAEIDRLVELGYLAG